MNSAEVVATLNHIPDGKTAWLSHLQYLELGKLLDSVEPPAPSHIQLSEAYFHLHRFLSEKANLTIPETEVAIHFNAFALLRRGYKIEDITEAEYKKLVALMDGIEQPERDDMNLYETGSHRALYEYLVKGLGLVVLPGRGPAWHRAKKLMAHYESQQMGR
jgi:hypothetical protein